MKNLKYIILLVAGCILTACNDYLDVMPENNQSSRDYWNNKEEVEAMLGAGYVKLRNCQESFFLWGEARGNGIMVGIDGTDLQKESKKLRAMNILPSNKLSKWDKLYDAINIANSVLKYGPEVVDKDPSFDKNIMNSFAAEAYFQRSLAYFYLVRLWREVPYVTEPYVDDDADYMVPQTNGQEILKNCLIDLNTALEYAKEKFEESSVDSRINTKGRATRWALYSLIADINLWLGNYDDCINACRQVINSGQVGLISGTDWFSNFYPGNSNESIFEIQYSKRLSQTNDFLKWFDVSQNYFVTDYTQTLFVLDDQEKRALNATYDIDGKIWKYIGIDAQTKRNSSEQNDQNWIVYRLADIYLMESEAYIMKSNFDKAMENINLIRGRAGLADLAGSSNAIDMLRILLEERQREFCAEGKNWFDILRVGLHGIEGSKELLIEQVINASSSSNAAMIRAKLQDSNSWYLPVNSDELNNNTKLVQNPYYANLGN